MAANQFQELQATLRPRAGKGAARATRREGKVPAVIYGDKKPPEAIAIEYRELIRLIRRGQFMSQVFDIKVDGRSERALPRDIQLDPVKDMPVHVDFQRISRGQKVRLNLPIEMINEEDAPGMKRGGVLNIVRHEVEVMCPPDNIPESLIVDLTGADIGDSIHISQVNLPEGVEPTITDRDFTIVTLAGSAAAKSEDDDAEEGDTEAEGAGADGDGDTAENKDEKSDD